MHRSRAYSAVVALLERTAVERADLAADDLVALQALVRNWEIVADLALSDLVLWVPTWNDAGFVAAAHVRPNTASTTVPEQIVGTFSARGRSRRVEQALQHGHPLADRTSELPWQPRGVETYPVYVDDRVIAVIERLPSSAIRVAGRLEEEYLRIADELFALIVADGFPPVEQVQRATGTVRVGDGLMRVDASGVTTYASPNAVSACRRLSWSGDVVGASLRTMVQRIAQRHGPVDDQIIQLVSGRIAGRADIEHGDITLLVRVVPMRSGALILLRDVTETRRRERELLTKDATIREIHHRVKNNLQTVAALLRLQGRRAQGDEAREVLREAQLRIGAIAVVHDLLATGGAADVPFAEVVDRIIGLLRDLAPAFGPNEIEVTRDGDCGSLPTEITTPLAMATMELLQNAFEHAGAKHIEVHLGQPSGDIRVEVRDDGVGISTPVPRDGLGLQIVESLITSELRGTFTIEAMTHGTRACLDVPMN